MLMLLPDFSPMRMSFRLCATMRGNVRRVHVNKKIEREKMGSYLYLGILSQQKSSISGERCPLMLFLSVVCTVFLLKHTQTGCDNNRKLGVSVGLDVGHEKICMRLSVSHLKYHL